LQQGDPLRIMITDIHMPDMDGFDLAERIKQTPDFADVAIIMLTSGEARGDIARSRAAGVLAHLTKPARRNELRFALVRAINENAKAHQPGTAADAAAAGDAREVIAVARPAMDSRRVLLVEDVVVNQMLATRILEKAGHMVTVASDGQQALTALEKGNFDVVLMDVQMPDMDGFEATRRVREREAQSGGHVPIVAMTAFAMSGDREKCIDAGMDGYLAKPIRSSELLAAISEFGGSGSPTGLSAS
jgi:CheY-like chemotaxis protein